MTGTKVQGALDSGLVRVMLTLLQIVTVGFLGYYASTEKEHRADIMRNIKAVAATVRDLDIKVDEMQDQIAFATTELAVTKTDVAGLRERVVSIEGRVGAQDSRHLNHIRDGHPGRVETLVGQTKNETDAVLEMHDRDIKRLDAEVQKLRERR